MTALMVNASIAGNSKQVRENIKKRLEDSIGSLYMIGYPSTQLLITSLLKGRKYLDRKIMVACCVGTAVEILEELV